MIQKLTTLDSCKEFIDKFRNDPNYSDPHLATPENMDSNLYDAVNRKCSGVFGVYREDQLIGLFSFDFLTDERYAEMIVGLSGDEEAYEEIAAYLQENYPGFQADFVFNPQNEEIRAMLKSRGASFDKEMQRMILIDNTIAGDTDGIEPLSERYQPQYFAMHETDCYWTAEKVADTPTMFNAFLAVDDGSVVGYLDITNCYDENEIYDMKVMEAYRRMGWGRKLLKKAIESNRPMGLVLYVYVDNAPAIKLYESVGFQKVPGQNSQLATWNIPSLSE